MKVQMFSLSIAEYIELQIVLLILMKVDIALFASSYQITLQSFNDEKGEMEWTVVNEPYWLEMQF